jgi:hypothetical protein
MRLKKNLRPDAGKADIVEAGIILSAAFGARRAAAFLSERGISDSVIARVLREPGRRRRSVHT